MTAVTCIVILSILHNVAGNDCCSPRGVTHTWWGRYGLCLRHTPTKLARSFYCPCVVSAFMALSTVFHSLNSPDNSSFSDCSSGLISAVLVLSTTCLFMKVSLSPDIILRG